MAAVLLIVFAAGCWSPPTVLGMTNVIYESSSSPGKCAICDENAAGNQQITTYYNTEVAADGTTTYTQSRVVNRPSLTVNPPHLNTAVYYNTPAPPSSRIIVNNNNNKLPTTTTSAGGTTNYYSTQSDDGGGGSNTVDSN